MSSFNFFELFSSDELSKNGLEIGQTCILRRLWLSKKIWNLKIWPIYFTHFSPRENNSQLKGKKGLRPDKFKVVLTNWLYLHCCLHCVNDFGTKRTGFLYYDGYKKSIQIFVLLPLKKEKGVSSNQGSLYLLPFSENEGLFSEKKGF